MKLHLFALQQRLIGLTCLLGLGLHGGCASKRLITIDTARQAFVDGHLTQAEESYESIIAKDPRFALPARLDLAVTRLAAGDLASAENDLRQLRDEFDSQSQTQIVYDVASLLADDNLRPFQPAGYEEVMIRSLLAMTSLCKGGEDAESYLNQAAMHQARLRSQYTERSEKILGKVVGAPHQELAFAPYLRGVIREASHRDFDDAVRHYRLVSTINPDFAPAKHDLQRAQTASHSRQGHGVLYVFGLVGRGPTLVPVDAPVTNAAVSIATALMLRDESRKDDVDQLPQITSVQIPGVAVPPSPTSSLAVFHSSATNDQGNDIPTVGIDRTQTATCLGATQTITDMTEMVRTQTEAEQPWVIARAFLRRATKQLAVAKARSNLKLQGTAGTLFQFAATTAWTGVESADTRCWGLLPREIQVLRAELPVGIQSITLAPVDANGQPVGPPQQRHVLIENGRNRYLIAIAPATKIYLPGGTVLLDRADSLRTAGNAPSTVRTGKLQ